MACEPVAIVGMGLRYPGADNARGYWKLLCEGVDAVRDVPAQRWNMNSLYDPDPAAPGKMTTRQGGYLDGVDQFDWRAFRINPREAKYMDPQHRLLLEVSWEALEDAGIPFEEVAGSKTGVFAGIMWNDYLRLQCRDWAQLDAYASVGNMFAFAPTRVSYTFDLKGPSIAVDLACASSLGAIHAACQSLLAGECEMAIAGGVELILSPDSNIIMSKTGMLSRQERCRTFDAAADGFVRGEGAGMLVLKRLSQVSAEDRVYALIRGSATNHNGRNEWIMAASDKAQSAVIRDACARAGVNPSELDYVELHGTGTPKGDPVEAKALGATVGTGRSKGPCIVGSVKSNMGHLGAASGVASVTKVALALHHCKIPPTLHFNQVNPAIKLEDLNLIPQRECSAWPDTASPALAGVTAVSLSGNNAHIVLEQYPDQDLYPRSTSTRSTSTRSTSTKVPVVAGTTYLLPLSAQSPKALRDLASCYEVFLRVNFDDRPVSLAEICFTASAHRTHYNCRLSVVSDSLQSCAHALQHFLKGKAHPNVQVSEIVEQRPDPSVPDPSVSGSSEKIIAELVQDDCAKDHHEALLRALGKHYCQGSTFKWRGLFSDKLKVISLPHFPWQREHIWLDWLNQDESTSQGSETRVDKAVERSRSFGKITAELREILPARRREQLRHFVRVQVLELLGLEPSFVLNQAFFELDMNSISAAELKDRLSSLLGLTLPPTLVFEYPTLDALTDYLMDQLFPPNSTAEKLTRVLSPLSSPLSSPAMSPAISNQNLNKIIALPESEVEAAVLAKLKMLENVL